MLEQHPRGVSSGVTAELAAVNGVAEVECRRLVLLSASSQPRQDGIVKVLHKTDETLGLSKPVLAAGGLYCRKAELLC